MTTFQELLERDAEKIKQIGEQRKAHTLKQSIEPEFLLLAELGMHFGWQAVKDVMTDGDPELKKNFKLSFDQMQKLLAACRRLESVNRYNRLVDGYAVEVSSRDKNRMFNRLTEEIKRSWQTQQ